jgi:hypothetical protein
MTDVQIEELVKACRAPAAPADPTQVEVAGIVRLVGKPALAPEGSVGLRLGDGATVLILASDVVRVDRDDDGSFSVGIRLDAPVLLASTSVRLAYEVAAGKDGECECSPPGFLAARANPFVNSSIGHCHALEASCNGSGRGLALFSGSATSADLQAELLHGARCRDVWFGCIARWFDSTFG